MITTSTEITAARQQQIAEFCSLTPTEDDEIVPMQRSKQKRFIGSFHLSLTAGKTASQVSLYRILDYIGGNHLLIEEAGSAETDASGEVVCSYNTDGEVYVIELAEFIESGHEILFESNYKERFKSLAARAINRHNNILKCESIDKEKRP